MSYAVWMHKNGKIEAVALYSEEAMAYEYADYCNRNGTAYFEVRRHDLKKQVCTNAA